VNTLAEIEYGMRFARNQVELAKEFPPMANRSRIATSQTRDYEDVKSAVAELIADVGGLEAAASLCRLQKSRLSRVASPLAQDAHLPIDVLIELESVASEPIVTSALARARDHLLISLSATESHSSWFVCIAKMAEETSDVFAAATQALQDGDLDKTEARVVLKEVDEALHAFACLRSALLATLNVKQFRSRSSGKSVAS
jgi:Phage regulatory protein CII (CP76)